MMDQHKILENWAKYMKLFSEIGQLAVQDYRLSKEGSTKGKFHDIIPTDSFQIAAQRGRTPAEHSGLTEFRNHDGVLGG